MNLGFGRWGALLVVETSLELVEDRRILTEMLMNAEPTYPLHVTEEHLNVVVDGQSTAFRMLRMDDDLWSAVAPIGERWVYLRGMGIPATDIAIEHVPGR